MQVILANPRGFCAGVDRAIAIVERALALFGTPIYVKHEVVHNKTVVRKLKDKGACFIEDLNDVPVGSILIFSAHGVSQQIRRQANDRQLTVFDATCPLVTKVHMEVARCSRRGEECILIGHAGHPEVEGTLGQYHHPSAGMYLVENCQDVEKLSVRNPEKLSYVTQTTLSVDETRHIIHTLKQRFAAIAGPKHDDICYATQNRQDAVKDLAVSVDLMLVVGSQSSSNSNRLRELAESLGTTAYLLDEPDQLQRAWLQDVKTIGITAGASAPEAVVAALVQRLQSWGAEVREAPSVREESISFALPKILREGVVTSNHS